MDSFYINHTIDLNAAKALFDPVTVPSMCGECGSNVQQTDRFPQCPRCGPRHAKITCSNQQCQLGSFHSVLLRKLCSDIAKFPFIFCSAACADAAEVIFDRICLYRRGEKTPFMCHSDGFEAKFTWTVGELVGSLHETLDLRCMRPATPWFCASTEMDRKPFEQSREFVLDNDMLLCQIQSKTLSIYDVGEFPVSVEEEEEEAEEAEEPVATVQNKTKRPRSEEKRRHDDDDDSDFEGEEKSSTVKKSAGSRAVNNTKYFRNLQSFAGPFQGSTECRGFLSEHYGLSVQQQNKIAIFKQPSTCVAVEIGQVGNLWGVLVFANLEHYENVFQGTGDISEPVFFQLKKQLLAEKYSVLRGVCVVSFKEQGHAADFVEQANNIGFNDDAALCELIREAKRERFPLEITIHQQQKRSKVQDEDEENVNLFNGGDEDDTSPAGDLDLDLDADTSPVVSLPPLPGIDDHGAVSMFPWLNL